MKIHIILISFLTCSFLFVQSANALTGIWDDQESQTKNEINKGPDEENKAGKTITDKEKLELYGGHSAPWNIASKGSTIVKDVEIKGLRLGIPEVLIDEILKQHGFEKTGFNQYSKDLVEVNGEQKEVTQSMQIGKSSQERGTLLRRYIIAYKSTKVTDDLIDELEDPLRSLAKEGQEKQQALKAKHEEQRSSPRKNREKGAKIKYDRFPVDVNSFRLVYEIEYVQSFMNGSQYDQKALMDQIKGIFGEPTYAPASTHARSGSAFGTSDLGWLIYHDAATVPVSDREQLLRGVEKRGDRWALKNAFSHPCGASPYPTRMNCVAAPITSAYSELPHRLAAARLIYAPVMMVQFKSPVVKTRLAWEYIHTEEGIRKYFNNSEESKKGPKAKVDF